MEKLLDGGGQTSAGALQDSRLRPVNTSGPIMSQPFRNGVAVYQGQRRLRRRPLRWARPSTPAEKGYGINSMMTLSLFGSGNCNVVTDAGMLREFLSGPGVVASGRTLFSPRRH